MKSWRVAHATGHETQTRGGGGDWHSTISVAAAPAWSRLRAVANTGSEPSRTELIPNKEAASQIQLELRLRLRSRLKPAWPSS